MQKSKKGAHGSKKACTDLRGCARVGGGGRMQAKGCIRVGKRRAWNDLGKRNLGTQGQKGAYTWRGAHGWRGVCAQVEGCMHGSRGARMDREGYV
jgi:hypothetical protein